MKGQQTSHPSWYRVGSRIVRITPSAGHDQIIGQKLHESVQAINARNGGATPTSVLLASGRAETSGN